MVVRPEKGAVDDLRDKPGRLALPSQRGKGGSFPLSVVGACLLLPWGQEQLPQGELHPLKWGIHRNHLTGTVWTLVLSEIIIDAIGYPCHNVPKPYLHKADSSVFAYARSHYPAYQLHYWQWIQYTAYGAWRVCNMMSLYMWLLHVHTTYQDLSIVTHMTFNESNA